FRRRRGRAPRVRAGRQNQRAQARTAKDIHTHHRFHHSNLAGFWSTGPKIRLISALSGWQGQGARMRLAALGLLMILSACATGRDVARSADCPAETFTIYFALDATTLDPIAGEVLDIAAARVVGCPGRLEVAGYADPSGDAVINERLSAER